MFCILDDDKNQTIDVAAIHDESGYRVVREALSAQYNLSNREPNIQVYSVAVRGDRSLTLHHTRHNRMPLESKGADEVLRHIHRLWGFDVHLYSVDEGDVKQDFHCPEPIVQVPMAQTS